MPDSLTDSLTPTIDAWSLEVSNWPSAPNGEGSSESDWDQSSWNLFLDVLCYRMELVDSQEGADALVVEATEQTNIPIGQVIAAINMLVGGITIEDPVAALLQQLQATGMDMSVLGDISSLIGDES